MPIDSGMAAALRILVVDPDDGVARTATRQLEALGHVVVSAADATGALARCDAGEADVVLYELMTPGADAHAFLELAHDRGFQFPVVVMAVDPEAVDVVQAFRAGARDFLIKPLSRLELKGCLGRLFSAPGIPPQKDSTGPRAITDEGEQSGETMDGDRMRRQLFRQLNAGDLNLPVPTGVLARITKLANNPTFDADEVIRAIESQVLLARAVLKLARTAQFRGASPPASVREAVARVGVTRALSNAVTAAQRANYELQNPLVGKLAGRLWLSHFIVALTAEVIGERLEMDRADRLQTMALFSEVGELVMLRTAGELWPEQVTAEGPAPALVRLVAENRAKVSAMLLADWGMPADFIVVARWAPPAPLRSVRPEIQHALGAIAKARQMSQGLLGDNPFGSYPPPATEDLQLMPSFTPDVGEDIRREAVERARSQLGVR